MQRLPLQQQLPISGLPAAVTMGTGITTNRTGRAAAGESGKGLGSRGEAGWWLDPKEVRCAGAWQRVGWFGELERRLQGLGRTVEGSAQGYRICGAAAGTSPGGQERGSGGVSEPGVPARSLSCSWVGRQPPDLASGAGKSLRS